MKTYITLFLMGLGNALALTAMKLMDNAGYNIIIAAGVGIIAGLTFTKVMEYSILERPLRWKWVRSEFDPRAAVEGLWFEHIPDLVGQPYTLLRINYDPKSKDYHISGNNYNEQFKRVRTFTGIFLCIDTTINQVMYTFEANQGKERASDAIGICHMTFHSDQPGKKNYAGGSGFFFNRDPVSKKFWFSFWRAELNEGEDYKKMIKRMSKEKIEDE
jgi:hypothetical protein